MTTDTSAHPAPDLHAPAATPSRPAAGPPRNAGIPNHGRRHRRGGALVPWLRKTHGWFGLWGATLGLALGISGIWLNHRAVLKLPPVAQQRSETQLALPDPAPADAQALAAWLQVALHLPAPATSVRVEPSRPVPWAAGGRTRGGRAGATGAGASDAAGAEAASVAAPTAPGLRQPEHWTIAFGGPQATIQADAWAGNRSVGVRRTDNGVLGTLMNLHKGIGLSTAWILFADTVAGSFILLSLSGVALWLLTHRRRAVGLAILGASVALTLGLAMV